MFTFISPVLIFLKQTIRSSTILSIREKCFSQQGRHRFGSGLAERFSPQVCQGTHNHGDCAPQAFTHHPVDSLLWQHQRECRSVSCTKVCQAARRRHRAKGRGVCRWAFVLLLIPSVVVMVSGCDEYYYYYYLVWWSQHWSVNGSTAVQWIIYYY